MDSLDILPEIPPVSLDQLPRVDAFPQGPPPHPSLLRRGKSSHKGPLGWKGNGTLPFPCLSCPPRPLLPLQYEQEPSSTPFSDLLSTHSSISEEKLAPQLLSRERQQVPAHAQVAIVKRGPGRPRKNPKPNSPLSSPGYLCQPQQQQLPLQLMQQHGMVGSPRRASTPLPCGSCSEGLESQAAMSAVAQLLEAGSLLECSTQVPDLHTCATFSSSSNGLKKRGESSKGRTKHCRSNVCNSDSFKAFLSAGQDNNPPQQSFGYSLSSQTTRSLASTLPCGKGASGEKQAMSCQANASDNLLHSDAMLDDGPSLPLHLDTGDDGFQGILDATKAESEIVDGEAFVDHIDVLAKDRSSKAFRDSLQDLDDNLPPRIDSPTFPPLLHNASDCHLQRRSDFLDKGGIVDAVAIIQSPKQPKAKNTQSSRSAGGCDVFDFQWENKMAQIVEAEGDTYTLRAHGLPNTDVHGPDQRCSDRQPVHSTVQPFLLALASHGKQAHDEAEGSVQQLDTEEFLRRLDPLRSPSPGPFLQRQMDFPMDLPTLECTFNASPYETSGPSGAPGLQVIFGAPSSESQIPRFGPRKIGEEPMLPSHTTSREGKVLPHGSSHVAASDEMVQVLGGSANALAPREDFLTQGCSEEKVSTSTTRFPETSPSLVGPPSYLTDRCPDRNLVNIVSHGNECKLGDTEETPLAAASGKMWDTEAFKAFFVGENEAGDRDNFAQDTNQESRRLRPAVADGEERVLTKEMLQSVYHLPINEAAAHLQVGVTVLKKFCRQHNVGRWPYRKLLSVDKLVRSVEEQSEKDPAGANFIIRELGFFKQEIYNDPEVQLDDKIKKLRQANFKMQYKQRRYAGKHAMGPGVLEKIGTGCKKDERRS